MVWVSQYIITLVSSSSGLTRNRQYKARSLLPTCLGLTTTAGPETRDLSRFKPALLFHRQPRQQHQASVRHDTRRATQ